MDIKNIEGYIEKLEEKSIGEIFEAEYDDTNKIATYNNDIDDTILKVFYNKEKDITVLEFFDNKYYTTEAFKTKINPDALVLYHTYSLIETF
jgi:hypothetical protein